MRKRIAVVSKSGRVVRGTALPNDAELELVGLRTGEPLPAATVALIAQRKDLGGAIEAALALGRQQEQLLEVLAEAIDCREAFTPGSSLRVRDLATKFARAAGLDSSEQLTLERGALVRDIGKLRIPNEILLKDALLTYEDWETLRQHTKLGADLALELGAISDTADIVRYHHECYDGTGYPAGLEGEAIPRLARMMKIVDVYCAMTSARRYREGISNHHETLDHLRNERGQHFDPGLVDIFIEAGVGVEEK